MLDQLRAVLGDRYQVERELGQGGMALVFLARDLRHDRAVALKVLRPELSAVIGTERFLHEIRVTANLQHAHILPLYDSGSEGGLLYYVMPYIDGESLRDRLKRERQLSIGDTVRMMSQVADALHYAHRHDVLHRDIKPENILLHEGQALLADFGIAMALHHAGGTRLTETGLMVGTPQYMSPEQAAGDRDLDARSDQFSLAAVMYEMLAGEPPFTGPSVQAILTKLVTDTPRPVRQVRETISPELDEMLQQALAKVPADRFASIAEFAEALGRVPTTHTPSHTVVPTIRKSTHAGAALRWSALAAGAVALAMFAGFRFAGSANAERHIRFVVPTPNSQVDPEYNWAPTLAIGDAGHALVYRGGSLLQVRTVDNFTPRALAGTEGASMPAFSPDGKWIVFHQQGHLRKIALTDGSVVEIAPADVGLGLTWGVDDRIYFSSLGGNGGIWRVPAAGGTPEAVTEVADSAAEVAHTWPQLLPGGKSLLYTVLGPSGGALDSRIVIEAIGSGVRRKIVDQATFGRYLNPGQLLYVSNEGSVFTVPFDVRRGVVTGTPQQMLADVRVASWGGAALLAVAEDGTLAYEPGSVGAPQVIRTVDRAGRALSEILPTGYADGVRLSPSGQQLAANVRAPSKNDIWLFGPQGEPERLTFDEAEDEFPVWSPDGKSIAYTAALASQARRIQIRSVEAGTRPRRVLTWPRHLHLSSWSPDGRWLLGADFSPGQGQNVWAIAADGSDSIPVAATAASESEPDFSPDGRWVAYQSDESGRMEIFVVSFPDLAVKRQISINGGHAPRWDRRGSALNYLENDRLMSVPIVARTGLTSGASKQLFQTSARVFDVSADGSRFVLILPNPALAAPGVYIVVAWVRELGEKNKRTN